MRQKKLFYMFMLMLLMLNLCACGDNAEIMEDFKDNLDLHSQQATGKTFEENINDVVEEIDEIINETNTENDESDKEEEKTEVVLTTETNTIEDVMQEQVNNSSELKRYTIGDKVELQTIGDEGDVRTVEITFTECGTLYDSFYGTLVYACYEIQNTSDKSITVGNGLFNVYADNYMLEQFALKDDVVFMAELSGGRQMSGTVYVELEPDSVSLIEIECGDVVWVLKEPTPIVGVEEIPETMIRDIEQIPHENMAGEYVGITGLDVALSMYSSIEDEYVGNIEMRGVETTKGKLVQIDVNVYQVTTTSGEVVLIGVYTDNGNVGLDMYIDGQQMDYFTMTSPFIS